MCNLARLTLARTMTTNGIEIFYTEFCSFFISRLIER